MAVYPPEVYIPNRSICGEPSEREVIMKKKLVLAAAAAIFTLSMGMTAAAGQWQLNTIGWWWQNDDGTWPANCWAWIDGNSDGIAECYYFNAEGYMLANTVTPDNCAVNADGAWTENGVVQTQAASAPGVLHGSSSSAAQTTNSTTKATYLAYGFTDAVYDMLHSDRAANAARYGVVAEELYGSIMLVTYANDIVAIYENNAVGTPDAITDLHNLHAGQNSPTFAPFASISRAASASAADPETAANPVLSQFSKVFWFLLGVSDVYGLPENAARIDSLASNTGYLYCGDDSYLEIVYYPEEDSWSLMIFPQ